MWPRSIAGGLPHRSRSGYRPVVRVVHLLEGAALGFGAEHPEADDAENVPAGEIDEGRAEHDEVWRCRLDDVAGAHDHRQTGRPQDLAAEVADAIAHAHTAAAQPGWPDLRHIGPDDRVDRAAEKASRDQQHIEYRP